MQLQMNKVGLKIDMRTDVPGRFGVLQIGRYSMCNNASFHLPSAISVSHRDVLAWLFTSDRFLKIERFPLTYHRRMRRRSRNQRLASNPERTRSNAGPSKAHCHCRTVPISFAIKGLVFQRQSHRESQPRSASETTASSGASSILVALSISTKCTS